MLERIHLVPPIGVSSRMTISLVLIGLAAGVLSGLFGIGGGVLIVPALALIANMPLKMATGTSLGALLLPVGLFGAMAYHKAGNLDIRASALIAAGLTIGVFLGAKLVQQMDTALLQRLFAVFLIVVAVRMWIKA